MPGEFPAIEFADFMARAKTVVLRPKGTEWRELGGASNLMGWRFRNAADGLDEFAKSWAKYGDALATHEVGYKRERALFSFFCGGVSCIEATCYGIYALCSHAKILSVPFGPDEQRGASPRGLRDVLKKHPTASVLTKVLNKMLGSPEWKTWLEVRNRIAHRSNLPPIITMSTAALPYSPPINVAHTSSTKAFGATVEDMYRLLTWLGETQRELFLAATALVP